MPPNRCLIEPRPHAPTRGRIVIRRTYDIVDDSSAEGGENEADYAESGWLTNDDQEWALEEGALADENWHAGRARSTTTFTKVDAARRFLVQSGCDQEWSDTSGQGYEPMNTRGESRTIGCHIDTKQSDPRLVRKLTALMRHGPKGVHARREKPSQWSFWQEGDVPADTLHRVRHAWDQEES